jgi:hypothetical protein
LFVCCDAIIVGNRLTAAAMLLSVCVVELLVDCVVVELAGSGGG